MDKVSEDYFNYFYQMSRRFFIFVQSFILHPCIYGTKVMTKTVKN